MIKSPDLLYMSSLIITWMRLYVNGAGQNKIQGMSVPGGAYEAGFMEC